MGEEHDIFSPDHLLKKSDKPFVLYLGGIEHAVLDALRQAKGGQVDLVEKLLKASLKIVGGTREMRTLTEAPEATLDLEEHIIGYTKTAPPEVQKTASPRESAAPPVRFGGLTPSPPTQKDQAINTPPSTEPRSQVKLRTDPFLAARVDVKALQFAEPPTPAPKQRVLVVAVVDDIVFYPFKACSTCSDLGKGCTQCESKGGVRAELSGFTLAESAISVTLWGSQLAPLTGMVRARMIQAAVLYPDHLRVAFLELYRGKLLIVDGTYSSYRGELSLVGHKAACLQWEALT